MKTKNIALTDKQFESLLQSVAVASSVYGVMSDMVDDKYKKQADAIDDAEKILCEYAYAFGLSKVTEEYDEKQVIDMKSDWYEEIFDDILEYNEYETFHTLSNKLGWRDFRVKYTEEEIRKIMKEHGDYLGVPLYDFENKYHEEFEKYDYDRLYIDEAK